MVTVNNEDLRNVYHYLVTIENIIQKEIRLVKGNKHHLDKIVPEELTKIYSAKEKTALSFVDNLTRVTYENSIIMLVSTFERIVFAKYRTSYGSIKTTVNKHSAKPLDYYSSREKFINDGIENLSGILYLIEGIIEHSLFDQLKKIKDHRNYIAHGKRDSQPPAIEFTIDEIASLLDRVITEIEK
jgi:hypothetical protein